MSMVARAALCCVNHGMRMGEICTIPWAISPLTNGQITPVIINFRPI
ncbi:hypothetical protein Krac_1894 [Ktedonobacter racemifer DSM 44963]|uniref:Uncharacterized protein n=1 Tax=Ktedonobacter racemifer DSM 44963 TaxID=485913 RepID=D6U3V6_KTERA|nr:hypothetical protein Krac_1894 [Ktedonobacter racemifer DSM 44963]